MVNFESAIFWCDIILISGYLVLIGFLWYYFAFFSLSFRKPKKISKGINQYRYCVLIPARDESKVIHNILSALKKQTYDSNLFKVIVIVENEDDPTINIVKGFGYDVFIRKDLKNRSTKGYALQEVIKYLKDCNQDNFDAFMIFDADNVMDNKYLEKMNDLKNLGYQVGFGYRNFTNATVNWITECSALLFSLVNSVFSKGRSILFKKIMLNGTGYFIDKKIIDDAGGWIFTGMTEDVQLTTYCTYHNVSMGYYENIQYYDEQPEKFSVMHKQHLRWIWGFFKSRKEFKKTIPDYKSISKVRNNISKFEFNCTVIPILIYIVFSLVSFLVELGLLIASFVLKPDFSIYLFGHMQIPFFSIYLIFFIISIFILVNDNKHIKFSLSHRIRAVFTFPFFFFDFIFAFLDGLIHPKKRKTWTVVDHQGDIKNQEALKVEDD